MHFLECNIFEPRYIVCTRCCKLHCYWKRGCFLKTLIRFSTNSSPANGGQCYESSLYCLRAPAMKGNILLNFSLSSFYVSFLLFSFNQVSTNGSGNLETTTFSVSVSCLVCIGCILSNNKKCKQYYCQLKVDNNGQTNGNTGEETNGHDTSPSSTSVASVIIILNPVWQVSSLS